MRGFVGVTAKEMRPSQLRRWLDEDRREMWMGANGDRERSVGTNREGRGGGSGCMGSQEGVQWIGHGDELARLAGGGGAWSERMHDRLVLGAAMGIGSGRGEMEEKMKDNGWFRISYDII